MTALITEKGTKLYGANNEVRYYQSSSFAVQVTKAPDQKSDPMQGIDDFVGVSTGNVENGFVQVDWTDSYPTWNWLGIQNGTASHQLKSWVQLSDVKNETTDQEKARKKEEQNVLLKNALGTTPGLTNSGGGSAGTNKTMYYILGAVFALVAGLISWSLLKKPKPTATVAAPKTQEAVPVLISKTKKKR